VQKCNNLAFAIPINQIGRWCSPTTPKYQEKAALIMDRSNEDHCGSCGNNLLHSKNDDVNYIIINTKNQWIVDGLGFHDNERYYFPFTI
jgi:hypothetical protein